MSSRVLLGVRQVLGLQMSTSCFPFQTKNSQSMAECSAAGEGRRRSGGYRRLRGSSAERKREVRRDAIVLKLRERSQFLSLTRFGTGDLPSAMFHAGQQTWTWLRSFLQSRYRRTDEIRRPGLPTGQTSIEGRRRAGTLVPGEVRDREVQQCPSIS